MKNITLSIPDDLLIKAREYAKNQGTSLNEMVRDLLRKNVEQDKNDLLDHIEKFTKELKVDSKVKYTRDELHER